MGVMNNSPAASGPFCMLSVFSLWPNDLANLSVEIEDVKEASEPFGINLPLGSGMCKEGGSYNVTVKLSRLQQNKGIPLQAYLKTNPQNAPSFLRQRYSFSSHNVVLLGMLLCVMFSRLFLSIFIGVLLTLSLA